MHSDTLEYESFWQERYKNTRLGVSRAHGADVIISELKEKTITVVY